MVALPLGKSDWTRTLTGEARIRVLNRYFEENPANRREGSAALTRPGLKRWLEVGDGPIRSEPFSQPGTFNNDLFVLSGDELWRVSQATNATTLIGSGFFQGNPTGFGRMAATAALGSTPAFLYITDTTTLWLFMDDGYAMGVLTASAAILNNDVIEIGGVYYKWTNASVDAGTPAGTSANPWLVALGGSNSQALDNMRLAINAEGVAGVTYSTALTAHPTVLARSSTGTTLRVQARDTGAAGNAITTTETGANIAWGGATLAGGGAPFLTTVDIPDGLSPFDVGFIAGYVIVVTGANSASPDLNGRFFWIEPGETFIRPLNFATAERSPDPVFGVRVVGDQFWLLGVNTTEVWYPSGDEQTPFVRIQGQLFDRGIVEGTDVQIKDIVILVDQNGEVYIIRGEGPQRVSDHSIEERIRAQLRLEQVL